jgi:predicted ArsR family transcriptional regulator
MLLVSPAEIDAVVHAPARLAIMTLLATHGPQDFATIKQQFPVTDGALGSHLQRLLVAGYAKCDRAFFDGRPRSTYHLSQAGRTALHRYVDLMEAWARQVRASDRQAAARLAG